MRLRFGALLRLMILVPITLTVASLILLWLIFRHMRRNRLRGEMLKADAPDSWAAILAENVRFYAALPARQKKRLHGYMHVFLVEKRFEACGDLEEITEEMQVTIAAQACLLLLNGRNGCYEHLQSILLYPDAYMQKGDRHTGDGIYEEGGDSVLLGESWGSGSVVLSWASVLSGGRNDEDGQNVVIHEFAHQLDQAGGSADGAPALADSSRYVSWSRTMQKAFKDHVERTDDGKRTVIDKYGATNPAEFFAVSTETFFEKPEGLKKRYPGVYRELKAFYQLDPIHWKSV
jgi:Mlc titration factor MtfA (ptsG expression regulator)